MKKLFFAFFLLVTFQLNSTAQVNSKQKQAVLAVLNNQQLAWNNANIDTFMSYYWENDSLQFIGKKGITYGWKNTLDNYKKSYPDAASMGKLNFEVIQVIFFNKKQAYVLGKWNLIRAAEKGNIGGHFTLLFKKINNKWLIISDHTS
jgi:ketosteroid isomerase-like protein